MEKEKIITKLKEKEKIVLKTGDGKNIILHVAGLCSPFALHSILFTGF
jgi:soluble P-type ATPase